MKKQILILATLFLVGCSFSSSAMDKKEKTEISSENLDSSLKKSKNLNDSQNQNEEKLKKEDKPIIEEKKLKEIEEEQKICFEKIISELDNLEKDYEMTKKRLEIFELKILAYIISEPENDDNFEAYRKSKLLPMLYNDCSEIKSLNEKNAKKTNDIYKKSINELNNFVKYKNLLQSFENYRDIILKKIQDFIELDSNNEYDLKSLEEEIKNF